MAALPVRSARVNVNDGHEVLGKLLIGIGASHFFFCTNDDQLCSELLEKELDKVVTDSRQSVPVGNHNLLDVSCENVSNQG